jgi:hypothetical protein
MDEKSARDRLSEMLQQRVYPEVIRQAPNLEPGDEHPSVVEVQNFLKRFGYLDAVAEGRTPEPGRLDEVTVRALVEYQRVYNVGRGDGTLDASTRELMVAPRCSMPDILPGPTPRFFTTCAWPRRAFTYAFDRVTDDLAPAGTLPPAVGHYVVKQAVKRAFATWADAGVGLTFTEVEKVENPDILIDWRPAICSDEGLSMVGQIVAHSDFPIGCEIYEATKNKLPKPLHFDDEEIRWGLEWVEGSGAVPIEDVAVHEIGHFLGLNHGLRPIPPFGRLVEDPPKGNVMHAHIGFSGRTLGFEDYLGIGRLYPPVLNHIANVHNNMVLDVADRSFDDGAKIQQWSRRGFFFSFDDNQRFRMEKVAQPQNLPEYRFVAFHSNKVLDVTAASTANGAKLQQFEWRGTSNQRFRLEPVQSGGLGVVFRIVAVHSNKVLEVPDSSTALGVQIQQNDRRDGNNQLWQFQ